MARQTPHSICRVVDFFVAVVISRDDTASCLLY